MGDYDAAGSEPVEELGQPEETTGPETLDGQSTNTDSQTEEQPDAGTDLTVDKEPEDFQAKYKSLQTEFNTRNESNKELQSDFDQLNGSLDKFGGMDGIQKWADWIAQNEQAIRKMSADEQYNVAGIDMANADDETKRAIQMIETITDQRVKQQVEQAMKEQVQPLSDSFKKESLDKNMNELSDKYGDSFEDLRDEMATLSEKLPAEVQDNPSLEHLEDLYWKALRTTGKMEDYASNVYKKQLEDKKSKSTEKPDSPAGKSAKTQATSVAEAFRMAQEETGYKF